MRKILTSKLFLGIVVSNIFALFVVGVQTYLNDLKDGLLIFSEFIIVPLAMGMISAWFWQSLALKMRAEIGYNMLSSLVTILLSYFFLKEGMICLIIVCPLIFCFTIKGYYFGKSMFRKKNKTLNLSILGLLIIVFVIDSISPHQHQRLVSDEMVIKASAADVWEHVIAFDDIKQKEQYWLFKIGMPSPMATTVSEKKLGANRKCIFSNGYIFDEKITAFEINKNLTFEIVGQPRDPEIMGHIDIQKGQFLLKDNGDGTTTLIGNSWYKLHVFPAWYFDFWAESITRNVHFRVMEHIKQLSEGK